MADNVAVKSAQQRRTGALVLNSTQVGLALGFVVVGVIAAFGVGFIAGMWYQANEHITPYGERPAPMAEEQSESQGMTFYSTLTTPDVGTETPVVSSSPAHKAAPSAPAAAKRDVGTLLPAVSPPPAAKPAPGAQEAANRLPTRPVTPATPPKAGERSPAPGGGPSPAHKAAPSAPAAAKRDVGTLPPVGPPLPVVRAASGVQEAAGQLLTRAVTPSAPHAGERPPAPGGASVQPEKSPVAAVQAPPRPSGAGYSVQVGSFHTPEQAEQLRSRLAQKGYPVRVQVAVLPGKGTWYRVRVGHFPDRTGADQAAHRLTTQERLSAIVADAAK